jgi:hypothetical protein
MSKQETESIFPSFPKAERTSSVGETSDPLRNPNYTHRFIQQTTSSETLNNDDTGDLESLFADNTGLAKIDDETLFQTEKTIMDELVSTGKFVTNMLGESFEVMEKKYVNMPNIDAVVHHHEQMKLSNPKLVKLQGGYDRHAPKPGPLNNILKEKEPTPLTEAQVAEQIREEMIFRHAANNPKSTTKQLPGFIKNKTEQWIKEKTRNEFEVNYEQRERMKKLIPKAVGEDKERFRPAAPVAPRENVTMNTDLNRKRAGRKRKETVVHYPANNPNIDLKTIGKKDRISAIDAAVDTTQRIVHHNPVHSDVIYPATGDIARVASASVGKYRFRPTNNPETSGQQFKSIPQISNVDQSNVVQPNHHQYVHTGHTSVQFNPVHIEGVQPSTEQYHEPQMYQQPHWDMSIMQPNQWHSVQSHQYEYGNVLMPTQKLQPGQQIPDSNLFQPVQNHQNHLSTETMIPGSMMQKTDGFLNQSGFFVKPTQNIRGDNLSIPLSMTQRTEVFNGHPGLQVIPSQQNNGNNETVPFSLYQQPNVPVNNPGLQILPTQNIRDNNQTISTSVGFRPDPRHANDSLKNVGIREQNYDQSTKNDFSRMANTDTKETGSVSVRPTGESGYVSENKLPMPRLWVPNVQTGDGNYQSMIHQGPVIDSQLYQWQHHTVDPKTSHGHFVSTVGQQQKNIDTTEQFSNPVHWSSQVASGQSWKNLHRETVGPNSESQNDWQHVQYEPNNNGQNFKSLYNQHSQFGQTEQQISAQYNQPTLFQQMPGYKSMINQNPKDNNTSVSSNHWTPAIAQGNDFQSMVSQVGDLTGQTEKMNNFSFQQMGMSMGGQIGLKVMNPENQNFVTPQTQVTHHNLNHNPSILQPGLNYINHENQGMSTQHLVPMQYIAQQNQTNWSNVTNFTSVQQPSASHTNTEHKKSRVSTSHPRTEYQQSLVIHNQPDMNYISTEHLNGRSIGPDVLSSNTAPGQFVSGFDDSQSNHNGQNQVVPIVKNFENNRDPNLLGQLVNNHINDQRHRSKIAGEQNIENLDASKLKQQKFKTMDDRARAILHDGIIKFTKPEKNRYAHSDGDRDYGIQRMNQLSHITPKKTPMKTNDFRKEFVVDQSKVFEGKQKPKNSLANPLPTSTPRATPTFRTPQRTPNAHTKDGYIPKKYRHINFGK